MSQPARERCTELSTFVPLPSRSLQGLDYFSMEGAQAFETLESVASTLQASGANLTWEKEMKRALKETKRYLKSDFKTHIGPDETCVDHCTSYSLSDTQNDAFSKECNHSHDTSCNLCCELDEVLCNINKMRNSSELTLTDQQQSQVDFDVHQAEEAIQRWKAHLLRTVNQEQAKEETLTKLNTERVLIVMDWAMKYLPQRHREKMSDFYGKRGKSWHVSCVVHKSGDAEYDVETMVHIFDSCTQDWFSVASIFEHLLFTIKEEHPNVKMACLKSDNAGCYHNASLILSLECMGDRTGIHVQRYDFSDPQSRKDVCDRKIAPMKGHMQRWVNERHDIVTAADMKEALESYGGVRGCRIAVAEVDVSKTVEMAKWQGISSLFNFEFLSSGIRAWKAYGVGEGLMFSYEKLGHSLQGPTGLRIVMPFTSSSASKPGLMVNKKPKTSGGQGIFMCEEEGCVATFPTQKEVQTHMDTGRHLRVMERETMYDLARKKWAEKVTGVQAAHVGDAGEAQASKCAISCHSRQVPFKGWALKTHKKGQRMTEKAKSFLVERFNQGVKTGNTVQHSLS